MKKLLLFTLTAVMFSCSSDDSDPVIFVPITEGNEYVYNNNPSNFKTITVSVECSGVGVTYCVLNDVYETVEQDYLNANGQCIEKMFLDLDGIERSGKIVSLGSGGTCIRTH